MPFESKSRTFTGGFTVAGSVSVIFDLFSPLGEKSWLPTWDPELLHPAGATWGHGLVFRTKEEMGDALWIVTMFDRPGHQVEYHRVEPDRYIARVEVSCHANAPAETAVEVTYEYIGLSESGNEQIAAMTEGEYQGKMTRWQTSISASLATHE